MLVFFTDTKVDDLDILWANKILLIPMFGFMFTVVGLTATSNAFNFLDGLNGLASGVALVALAIFIYYCFSNEKTDLMIICIILFSSIIGFWFVNICTGKLFLGDSGAYLIGVLIAWIGVNLTLENSNISSWAIFLIIIYPATELIFTCIRRILHKKSPFEPDNFHLHSMIYKICIIKFGKQKPILVNSFCGISCYFRIFFFIFSSIRLKHFFEIILLIGLFILVYAFFYKIFLTTRWINKFFKAAL